MTFLMFPPKNATNSTSRIHITPKAKNNDAVIVRLFPLLTRWVTQTENQQTEIILPTIIKRR
ncbi:MAG: hypothetical protein LBQ66_13495 [Planctomycetaceae bacterium]|nr:hypothetical protein [Planctomycetaceae bacterium]